MAEISKLEIGNNIYAIKDAVARENLEAKQDASTAINTSNIASQSVAHAATASVANSATTDSAGNNIASKFASLSTVATSGSYNDLSNKPTIPTNNNQLTNGAGYITGINSNMVTSALGYTPATQASVNSLTFKEIKVITSSTPTSTTAGKDISLPSGFTYANTYVLGSWCVYGSGVARSNAITIDTASTNKLTIYAPSSAFVNKSVSIIIARTS